MYKKGVSSYNAFVHEKKAELGGIGAGWSSAWNALPPSQKASYKEKALEMTRSQVPTKAQLLNNICNSIKELSKHGISVACVGGNLNDGSQILFGTPPTETFFIQRPNVLQDLLIFCKERSSNSPCPEVTKEQETDTKKLRKNAADHLNTLYRTATGLPKPFPYKKVFSGDVVVNGLPEDVLPLKFPSHYGEKKLKAILSCESIEVLSQQENTGVFEEADTSEELLNLEEYQEVTEEDAQVLLPLFPEIQTNGKKRKASKQKPVDSQEYLVEKIVSEKKIKGKKYYLVKWDGFPEEQNTWEPKNNIPKNVLDYFLAH